MHTGLTQVELNGFEIVLTFNKESIYSRPGQAMSNCRKTQEDVAREALIYFLIMF